MAVIYEIRVREHLDNCWARRFDGFCITHEENGTTLLVTPIPDQAALHGALMRVRDLGLTLLAVARVESEQCWDGLPGQEDEGSSNQSGPILTRR